jgi:hypothetical protein
MHFHYCNTWFEETLLAPKETLRHMHYLFQYLPILYAPKGSQILVDAFPLSSLEDYDIIPYDRERRKEWDKNASIEFWVNEDPLTTKLLSKEFLFYHTTRPQGSKIIHDVKEAKAFESTLDGRCVFKQFLSFSGMGHARKAEDIVRFPCLGEPWFERILDFSTQWIVHDSGIEYLGDTHLLVASGGGYRGTEIGVITIEKKYLDIHLNESLDLLKTIQALGFRGNVGMDSFIHKEGFVPICEMNPRKTMGYVALMYARKENLKQMRLQIKKTSVGALLPQVLVDKHLQELRFPKNLFLDKL